MDIRDQVKTNKIVIKPGAAYFLDLSGNATGDSDVLIADNLADALTIREGSNVYIKIATTNGSEAITLAKKLAATCLFVSTEQTGTGSAQNVAHGLSGTPTRVHVAVTESDGNAFDVAQGTHDATNVVVTVTSGVKFTVLAML